VLASVVQGDADDCNNSLKLVNSTRIENAYKVRTKNFVFYYVVVICTITKEKEQVRACVSRCDQST